MTKRLVRCGVAVMTTLLALVVLWQFRMVVVYVVISLALAAALRPLTQRLVGQGFVVRGVWILLALVVLGGFGFLFFWTGRIAVSEIQQLAHSVSAQDAWRLPMWLEGSAFQEELAAAAEQALRSDYWRPRPARAAGDRRLHARPHGRREPCARRSTSEHLLDR